MGLTSASARAHIGKWQAELHKNYYAWRRHWPTRLFHHSPLENAIAILRDGHLRARNDNCNALPADIAAPGVIDNRVDAHNRVRLYFRPKTPTQWHVEGVRKLGECQYGDQAHAPILYMFALDALQVLTLDDVWFSNKNMQLDGVQWGPSESFFDAIPFDKVYSEGGTGGDRSITDARCAEVLPATPLVLKDCLREIFCRSDPERDTLLYSLEDAGEKWAERCLVSDNLKVFQKDYAFVQMAMLKQDGFVFRLSPRRDYREIHVRLNVRKEDTGATVLQYEGSIRNKPEQASNWIIRGDLEPGSYLCRVFLERHLAFADRRIVGAALL